MPCCPQCGSDLVDSRFCAHCGAQVDDQVDDQVDAQVDGQVDGQVDADVPDNPYAIGSQSQVVGVSVGDSVDDSDAPEVPGFTRALRICLVEKYCNFRGRASRSEFWQFSLWLFIFWVSLFVASVPLMFLTGTLFAFLFFLYFLLFILPTLGAAVRRAHDVGLSSWIFLWLYAAVVVVKHIRTFLLTSRLEDGLLSPMSVSLVLYVGLQYVIWALWIGFIVVLCWPGTKGPNKYGPAPWKR